MLKTFSNLFINKRLFAILILGFSSGLPLALIGPTLQAWFTEGGVNVVTIGALSLVSLPYTLKFLWAPVMDHYRFPWLDKRRGWICLMQVVLVVTLFVLANMNPTTSAISMSMVALLIAVFSASQDISITAYQTDLLKEEERGVGVAYYIFAYRIAGLLSGGLALIMADYIGWKLTYQIMAIFLLITLFFTYRAPKPVEISNQNVNIWETIHSAIADLWQRENILLILLFIVFYKFGDAFALQLMTNFLLHGLGFSLSEVGIAYKFVGFAATILGAFIGGAILTRWNIYRALLIFGIAQTFSNLMFVVLAAVGKHFGVMLLSMFIENFCSGLSTAALLAFMMSLCNHRYSASQFALFSAIASLGRVLMGPAAGILVENVGWVQFYIWSFILCFPGIIFLVLLKNRVVYHAEAVMD